jgi:hypothetical protein
MLVYLQFIIRTDAGTALAWPKDRKGILSLTHEPLLSIGYGSEATAIGDLDRWLDKFKTIESAEAVVFVRDSTGKLGDGEQK